MEMNPSCLCDSGLKRNYFLHTNKLKNQIDKKNKRYTSNIYTILYWDHKKLQVNLDIILDGTEISLPCHRVCKEWPEKAKIIVVYSSSKIWLDNFFFYKYDNR